MPLDKNTLTLLRIPFSFFLMPLFIFALSQASPIMPGKAILSFILIHLLVYPASNGYNSYIDKDESPIGGLEKPPMPTRSLFYLTLCMDVISIAVSLLFIGPLFALCIVLYILASRAYSSKEIRLKKYPLTGFLVVAIFQGALTYYMSYTAITGNSPALNRPTFYLLLGCTFQIAGAYPLTQVYQHEQDYKDGVITLSYKLGYLGTFIFTALMFGLCNLFYFLHFSSIGKLNNFYIIQLFFLPIVGYFARWFYMVYKDRRHADFKHTMRMNVMAALCMNLCFITLYFINN